MTNFEKIKNMSSKEFAEKYARNMCNINYCKIEKEKVCPCYGLCKTIPFYKFNGCEEVFKKWLESEVE